jgi:hypothetical protein
MPNQILRDGQFIRGFYVNRARDKYPFQVNGDNVTKTTERDFRCRADYYRVGQVGIDVLPGSSPKQYLVAETDPSPIGVAEIVSSVRTFSSVPGDQVSYATRVITKPTAASAGGTVTATDYLYDSPSTAAISLGLVTRYNGYVFGPNNKIYGPTMSSTSVDSGANTRITATAHGIAGTEGLIVYGSGAASRFGIVAAGGYTVVDANTIDLLGYNRSNQVSSLAKYLRDYTPGTDRVGLRRTQKFYLPGVTSGITTPADIPLPALLVNDVELLASLLANTTGYQTYDASELTRWNEWPIYTQTYDEINMADL